MTETEPIASTLDAPAPHPMAPMRLFRPDSPVVTTAQELFAAHGRQSDGTCPCCGRPGPCPVAIHAMQVCQAAGVPARPVAGPQKHKGAKASAAPQRAATPRKTTPRKTQTPKQTEAKAPKKTAARPS